MKTATSVPAGTDMREFGMRPWRGADTAHTGDVAGYQGTALSVASTASVADPIGYVATGFVGGGVPTTGDVRPHLEAPPG
jgi:hypothetical protein